MAGPEDQEVPQAPTPAEPQDGPIPLVAPAGKIEVRELPPVVSSAEPPSLPPTNPDLLTGGGVADAHNTAAAPPAAVEADAPVVPAGTTGEFQAAAEGGAAPAARNRRASTRTTGPDGRPQIDFGTAIMEFFHMLSLLLSGRPGAAEEFRLRLDGPGGFRDTHTDPVEQGYVRALDRMDQRITPGMTFQQRLSVINTELPANLQPHRQQIGVMLDFIGRAEGAGYNTAFGGGTVNFTGMTIQQVLDWQDGRRNSPAGKYQFIRSTLIDVVDTNNIDRNALFNESMQDRLAILRFGEGNLDRFFNGNMSDNEMQNRLAGIWASIPDPETGQSRYHGIAGNRATNPGLEAPSVIADLKP